MLALPTVKALTIVSLLSITAGALVLVGQMFHLVFLQHTGLGTRSVQITMALCFALLGAALFLTQLPTKKYTGSAFRLLICLVIIAGILSVVQAPGTGISFVIFGMALLGFTADKRVFLTISQYLLHVVTAMSALSIIGYLYDLPLFYTLDFAGPMAFFPAVLLFLLSITTSLLHPKVGMAGLFTGNLVGNIMARRVLLLLIIVGAAFGAVKIVSGRYLLISQQTGLSLLVISFIALGLALIWYTARWLNKFDRRRKDAEGEVLVINEELEKRVADRSAKLMKLLEKLRESESKFKTAFEHSAVGMALVSLKGKWLKVNKRMCDLVGYREQELLTMSFQDLTHPDDQLKHRDVIDKALNNKNNAYKVEKRYICKNGTAVWVSINIATVTNKTGGPLYFVSQFEDITERKKAEQSLKTAYKQIQDHVNSIQDIAWKQSHLVRSPLANLKGLTEILSHDPADKETLNYIQAELERLDTALIEMAEDACTDGARAVIVTKRILGSPFKELYLKAPTIEKGPKGRQAGAQA